MGILLTTGCQRNKQELKVTSNDLKDLKNRIEKIEGLMLGKVQTRDQKNNLIPSGYIKSITFRLGSKDDRLRIYWADGSKSDLPCSKEQSIWVCG